MLWYAVGPGNSQARAAIGPTAERGTWTLANRAQREEIHHATATSSTGRSEALVDTGAIANIGGASHWSADPAAWQRFLAEAAASESDSQEEAGPLMAHEEEPATPREATEEEPEASEPAAEDQGGRSPWEQYFSLVLSSREGMTQSQQQ